MNNYNLSLKNTFKHLICIETGSAIHFETRKSKVIASSHSSKPDFEHNPPRAVSTNFPINHVMTFRKDRYLILELEL